MLDYGLQASPPFLRRGICLIERLQRMATRMVKNLRGLSYEHRLRRLNLFTFERRLPQKELILAYNLFQGRLNVPFGRKF